MKESIRSLATSTLLISCFLFLGTLGCKETRIKEAPSLEKEATPLSKVSDANARKDTDAEMIIGEKLINPYSTKNMKTAGESLASKGMAKTTVQIKTNYYYVRFLPETKEEYDVLNADSTVDLFNYPLDYEIVKQGNTYKDKTLGGAQFTWLYAAIPIENLKKYKPKHEILDELYLPFGNGKESATDLEKRENSFLKQLEEETLLLTGNKEEEEAIKNGRVANWYAYGRIRVWDERIHYNTGTGGYDQGAGFVPVPQCSVRANRWFTTKSALSEVNGTFFIDHGWDNGKKVNYSIKWDRADFDIRDGAYGQAHYNGPKIYGQWNLDIQEGDTPDNYIYAHVHRAAWYYFYNNTFGVRSPPSVGTPWPFGGKLHLGAKQGNGRAHFFAFNGSVFAAEVVLIFNLNNDDGRDVFGTTIHELTHASHWAMGMTYEAYCSNIGQAGRLAESWALAVGWHITRIVYTPQANPRNDFDAFQFITLANMGAPATCFTNGAWYTPLFIDLIDNFDQSVDGGGRPNDQASGYTITELQSFLIANPGNWYNLRTYLQNNSSNPTEAAASQLFSDYD